MSTQDLQNLTIDKVIKNYGEWTAMSIHYGNNQYTINPPKPDYRLKRIVQTASDILRKPLNEIRVLDLACLEGQYGIEFAIHGAQVVGIEIREANIEKAKFIKQELKLDNIEFYQDDVRNLNAETYGYFDVVICSGILYHLEAEDVFNFVKNIYSVCRNLTIFDTFISLSQQKSIDYDNETYWGLDYFEHDEQASASEKSKNLWASIDNASSFWLTEASLCKLISNVGFTSFYDCLLPATDLKMLDRKTYVAIKGEAVPILSSPITNDSPRLNVPEEGFTESHPAQIKRGKLFKLFKNSTPQFLKDMIKPVLRIVGYLPKDETPDYLKKQK